MMKFMSMMAMALLALCMTGCMSDKQTAYAASTAKAYYEAPNVAELWSVTSKAGNGRITFENFDTFTMNTPVPPKNIIPRDPGVFAQVGDVIKTVAPYAAAAYLLHGEIGDGGSTTINNAAPVAP